MYKSLVRYFDSFIAIETYICMTSMMMLDFTMEVSINKSLPTKDKTQAKLGHSQALLETLGHWYSIHFGIGFDKTLLFWNLG